MHLRAAATLLGAMLLRSPAVRAQVVAPPDSSRLAAAEDAGAKLIFWEASSNGQSEQSVYLRNTSGRPIEITSYEVYDCFNLAGRLCGEHTPTLTVRPGKTATLFVVGPRDRSQGWAYRYRFRAHYADVPVAPATAATQ